jgi:demethylmenaquinone methyltransferase/2-methoxy-6-polyprenyl-1,4-benzoquinol methylase
MKMTTTGIKQELVELYRRRAGNYDFTANLYYLLGYRAYNSRRRAINALQLRPGDTVVELCCGTGINFPLLQEKVGPEGRIIGVDLTDAMIEQARKKTARHGWRNVELIQSDVARYDIPQGVNGIFSSFALALCPEFDRVVKNAYNALAPGGRFVELGLTRPRARLRWLEPLFMAAIRPFGDPETYIDRRIWESVEKHFDRADTRWLYLKMSYFVTGEKQC